MGTKSVNDALNYASAGLKMYHIAADTNAALPAGTRIMKVIFSPTGAGVSTLYNAATVTGTAVVTCAHGAVISVVYDFAPYGLVFDVGVSIDVTTCVVEIFYVTD
jgi:hypothetical protein